MSRVGQISIASPGEPLQLLFNESELKEAIENQASAGDHVTLYPGNYTTFSQSETIFIPEGVSITILPGAKVEYAQNFRDNGNFSHDGDPFDSTATGGTRDHPLSNGTVERYKVPNFQGFIENIVDMNFGSEWAFESDLEDVKETVQVLDTDRFFDITADSSNSTVRANLGDTIELRTDGDIDITFDELASSDGLYIKWDLDSNVGVTRVFGGDKIVNRGGSATDDVTLDHALTSTNFTPNNDDIPTIGEVPDPEVEVVDSISTDEYGHVDGVRVRQLVEVVSRPAGSTKPQDFEGQDGDIQFVVIE